MIPLWVLLLIIASALSISWTTFLGAPWVPSSRRMVNKMLELADVSPDDVVYDLGCGDGRMIITAARQYGAKAVGFEIDPLRYIWCRTLIALLGLQGHVRVVFGDFFNQDLSGATVVTCYLLQNTNRKLELKLRDELCPGIRVVSNTFSFDGLREVDRDGTVNLYLYTRNTNFKEKTMNEE